MCIADEVVTAVVVVMAVVIIRPASILGATRPPRETRRENIYTDQRV